MSKYGVFSRPNTEKYGPEKTPYLDTSRSETLSLTSYKAYFAQGRQKNSLTKMSVDKSWQ